MTGHAVSTVENRLLKRLIRHPMGLLSLGVLAAVVLLSTAAPLLTSHGPGVADLSSVLALPGSEHPLGADGAGRDVLARLLYGGRLSLLAGALAMAVAMLIGVPAGLVGGYYDGRVDSVLSWLSDTLMSVPAMVFLFAVIAAVGPGTWTTMTVFGILLAPSFYRVARAAVKSVRRELYVDAAQVCGLPDSRIIARHILRVVRTPVIVQASFIAGIAVIIQAGIEFLGLGEPDVPSWGAMLNDAFTNIYTAPRLMVWPGIMLGVTVGALAIFGTALRDSLEERNPATVPRRIPPTAVSSPATTPAVPDTILAVQGLRVAYPRGDGGESVVVDGVTLAVGKGEVLGLVGESGSGKTQTAFALLELLPAEARVSMPAMSFDGESLAAGAMRGLRGRRIGYVPQEPMSNLDPSMRVGAQLVEPMRHHLGLSSRAARRRALSLLRRVGITDPQRVFAAYPHQVSGGMAQRILIAGAISCDPDLLIADEPTTALDVTIQAEVLDLLRSLREERGMALLLVTHDLGVVADICERVAVMQEGRIVETAEVHRLFAEPEHDYTRMLLASTLELTREANP
ncbi:MAG TPA: ABC transporter [Micromonosporaceae bacterium]|nr:ABC transporter [Micromonosporaceae bacterium]